MTPKNRLWLILALAVIYFVAFAIPNARGARDAHMLALTTQDEAFQYPFLIHMLTPGDTIFTTLKNFISYQHYIYGYPFYVWSAITVLPIRLIYGSAFSQHTQILLLFLRQGVSVLPMLLAIVLLVYLQTGLRSTLPTLSLFIFLAILPGIVRQNIFWWHPDALAVLMVILTFYFLDRDALRYGRSFYLAAITCGLAIGVKLIGVFFFLAIPVYLLLGILQRKITLQKALIAGVAFAGVMAAAIVLSNPLLLFSQTREKIIETHTSHNFSFRHGWETDAVYQTGPLSWLPVLAKWYAAEWFLLFALLSTALAAWRGKKRLLNLLILCWALPYAFYLFFFIAVRPDHYWLAVILPLFSSVTALPETLTANNPTTSGKTPRKLLIGILIGAILLAQFIPNLNKSVRLYTRALNHERLITACDTATANQKDGKSILLETNAWYMIERYDNTSQPPSRHFEVRQGGNPVYAAATKGELARRCQDETSARLLAEYAAEDEKSTHPAHRVYGWDGAEILP
ncbi:MAG: hypothetical protein HPY45_11370 [Anaerolineae bacterium]|nr:hypothetical protein [Anaerolineae bacterium]